MSNRAIREDEAERIMIASGDPVGTVFRWNERIIRPIKPDHRQSVLEMFQSGLVDALQKRGLLVHSWLSDQTFGDSDVVVEHQRIPFVTYPHEWTFSMLRDAATCVLETNEVAMEFGYELKDCHAYNVLFHNGRPLYCDLGSFSRRTPGIDSWLALEDFYQSYLYPLTVWSEGDSFLARQLLGTGGAKIPHHTFLGWKSTLLRRLEPRRRESLGRWYFRWQYLDRILITHSQLGLPQAARSAGLRLHRLLRGMLGGRPLQRLRRYIEGLKAPANGSEWGNYQDDFFKLNDNRGSPRFQRIAEIARQANPKSIIDLAGNSGAFFLSQHERIKAEQYCCVDIDDLALDRYYLRARQSSLPGIPACLNVINPVRYGVEQPFEKRLACDVVSALALTHHLFLRQGMDVSYVLSVFASMARRLAIVEFMPLGLYDGRQAPPLPSWYTLPWFREAFHQRFHDVYEEQLEENRIVFVGKPVR